MESDEKKKINRKERSKLEKVPLRYRSVEERRRDFEETSVGYTAEEAMAEAARCMRCGTVCYFTDTERERHAFGKTRDEKLDELLNKSPF